MDVFEVRDQLVADYREYTGSFVDIHDPRIRAHVDERMAQGYQWPDPWVSLNPNFAPGGTITELVAAGLLHPGCEQIFRLKADGGDAAGLVARGDAAGPVLRLHRHQRAVEIARDGHSYVLTTGTGSGKSLAYIIPIVDRVLRARADGSWRPGIKAIVLYPMNALANSQLGELGKFLETGFPDGPPVTFARYTGQENEEARQRVIVDPPDILLTNYVMLELVLTRPRERRLIEAAQGLEFLVLDELHTYQGRQGADVALLTRRLRQACGGPGPQCVGTSATMATEGDLAGRRQAVAEVASDLFGVTVAPEHVIGETLERVTDPAAITPGALRDRVGSPGTCTTRRSASTCATTAVRPCAIRPGRCCASRRCAPAAGTGSPPMRRNAVARALSCGPPTGSPSTAASRAHAGHGGGRAGEAAVADLWRFGHRPAEGRDRAAALPGWLRRAWRGLAGGGRAGGTGGRAGAGDGPDPVTAGRARDSPGPAVRLRGHRGSSLRAARPAARGRATAPPPWAARSAGNPA
ncbi:MAG: DEAD/DEAH box helicase [Streptosporangiaceae bacterium]